MNLAEWRNRTEWKVSLWHVLLVGSTVRLLLPLIALAIVDGDPQFHGGDTLSYIRPAVSLLSEGKFSNNAEPEILRTPGYPVFLIPAIVTGHIEAVTIILQVAVSALTLILIYRITLLLFERHKIAILSALLYALEPLSILYSSKLLSETLFSALVALFLYYLLRYFMGGAIKHLVVSAVALAASVYVRPIAYYLPILIFVILLVWTLIKRRSTLHWFMHPAIFLLISLGLIGIWQVRNRIQTGYSGFSSAAEHSLYFWEAASVLAATDNLPLQQVKEQMGLFDNEIYFQNFPEQRGWERSEIFRSMGRQGMEIILNNVGTYSNLVVEGTLHTLMDPAAGEYLRMFRLYPLPKGLLYDFIVEQGPAQAAIFLFKETPVVFWAILILGSVLASHLLMAVVGFVQSRMILSAPMVLFTGVTTYFLVLSAVSLGYSRARHPIMPMICVLSGYGLYWITRSAKRKWSPRRAELIPST